MLLHLWPTGPVSGHGAQSFHARRISQKRKKIPEVSVWPQCECSFSSYQSSSAVKGLSGVLQYMCQNVLNTESWNGTNDQKEKDVFQRIQGGRWFHQTGVNHLRVHTSNSAWTYSTEYLKVKNTMFHTDRSEVSQLQIFRSYQVILSTLVPLRLLREGLEIFWTIVQPTDTALIEGAGAQTCPLILREVKTVP